VTDYARVNSTSITAFAGWVSHARASGCSAASARGSRPRSCAGEYESRRGAMRPSSRGAVSCDAHVVGFGSRLTAPNHFVRPPFSADCQKGPYSGPSWVPILRPVGKTLEGYS